MLPSNGEGFKLANYWFQNYQNDQDVLQIASLWDHDRNNLAEDPRTRQAGGITQDSDFKQKVIGENTAIVYFDAAFLWPDGSRPSLARTVVHEVGHNFGLGRDWGGYVDVNMAEPNHLKTSGLPLPTDGVLTATGNCVMSYESNRLDLEFSKRALDQIRKYKRI